MIEDFVGRMFAIRDAAHLAHWAANGKGSFARHVALGKFYDKLIDKLDAYIEAYQGYFGLIGPVKPIPYTRENIQEQIKGLASWMEAHCQEICREKPGLENMLQDIEALFATTFYKLKNLE
jgi:DNA-binding ferritin-like protein